MRDPSRDRQAAGRVECLWVLGEEMFIMSGGSLMPTLVSVMRARSSRVFWLPALLLSACSEPADRPGVDQATWRVDSVPMLDIGSTADDTTEWIGIAEGVTMVGDSEIVVADRGFAALRYFDRTGQFVRASGRKGDGPGEFQYIARMHHCGDSLVIFELGSAAQYMVFGDAGRFGHSYRPSAPPGARFEGPYKLACAPGGTFVNIGWGNEPRVNEPQRIRGTAPLWLSGGNGVPTTVLGDVPASERFARPTGSGPHPLGKEPVIAIGRTRAYYGSADSFLVQVFDLQGKPLPPIRKASVPLATTDADRERFWLLDTLGKSPEGVAQRVRMWQDFTFPPTVPAYTAFVVDREDNLWVRMFPRSQENLVRWLVFSPSGEEIGGLDLPDVLAVHDIGADYVLGIETRQDDGGQQVRMYRLHRDETSPR